MKKCPFCAEQIQDDAIICRFCQRDLASGGPRLQPSVTVQPAPQWNTGVAAVLSLVIPGAGQMYRGKVGPGLVWLVFTVLGYMLFFLPGVIVHLACIFDAASGAPSSDESGSRYLTRCSHCGLEIARNVQTCPYCGKGMIAPALVPNS